MVASVLPSLSGLTAAALAPGALVHTDEGVICKTVLRLGCFWFVRNARRHGIALLGALIAGLVAWRIYHSPRTRHEPYRLDQFFNTIAR